MLGRTPHLGRERHNRCSLQSGECTTAFAAQFREIVMLRCDRTHCAHRIEIILHCRSMITMFSSSHAGSKDKNNLNYFKLAAS